MRNRNLKKAAAAQVLSILSIALVLSGPLNTAAQTKRRTTAKPTVAPARKVVSEVDPTFDAKKFAPFDMSKAMSAAYQSGVLPQTAAMPAGRVEEQAAFLADAVSKRDENSTAALMTALKAAGYGIRDAEGMVDYQRSDWQGMALDGWQVAAMARSFGSGVGIGLGKFGEGLELIVPEWKKETNAVDIVRGIREATRSERPSIKFWAHFIIELGRRANAPYNLLNDEEVKRARLDVVQMSLIITRMAADLNFAVKRQGALQQRADLVVDRANDDLTMGFVSGPTRGPGPQNDRLEAAPVTPEGPCTTTEIESLILDLNATGMGVGFGQFTGYLESKGVISSKPGAVLGGANALLIALKLIATYAALDSEITLDGDQMLTRTKTTDDGERKTLKAKVKIDLGRWQAMNCIRPALNAAGIDFSVPSNGALAGTRVDWNLVEGGVADSAAGNVWHTVKNLPSLIKDGTMDMGEAIVFLDTQAGLKNEDKKHYNYTDTNGESKIDAVGLRQKRNMANEKLRPVMKRMSVSLDMQIKTMRISDATGAAGTANDLAGNAIAFFTKDVPGFVYGTAAETIYRSNLGSSKIVTFPVKDWQPCDGGWSGKITRTTKYRKDDPNVVNYSKSTSGYKEWTEKVELNVTGQQNEHDGILVNGWLAAGKVKFDQTIFRHENDQKYECTVRHSNSRSSTRYGKRDYRDKHVDAIDQEVDTTVYVAVYSDYAYLDFSIPGTEGDSFYDEKQETPCPEFDKHNTRSGKESWPYKRTPRGEMEFKVEYDPRNPGVLKGSRTVNNSDGSVSEITWDLTRCVL